MSKHPLAELIRRKGAVVIDGAMSTALESMGCDLDDPLWCAKILLEDPEKILRVHRDYFDAGADFAITASYQATEQGFLDKGCPSGKARELVMMSVGLAKRAREEFVRDNPEKTKEDLLVAGSVGPYGAYLSNGAEYTGDYHLAERQCRDFHLLRLEALIDAGADFLAIETMPRLDEVGTLLKMTEERGASAWVTVTLRDSGHMCDGTPLEELGRLCEKSGACDAVGFNCVRRELVSQALRLLSGTTSKPLIVYPNSGETYDAKTGSWRRHPGGPGWKSFVPQWHSLNAACIGGCCRALPSDIVQIASMMRSYQKRQNPK